jgi:hypothetical protein
MADHRSRSARSEGDPLLPGTATGADLAAVSRRGAREFDSEMADAEAEAERYRLRGRTVVDAMWEAMNRGDSVSLVMGDRTLAGALVAVRNDLALLQQPDALAAVRIGGVDALRMDPGDEGVAGDRTHGSLASYLRMLMLDRVVVTVLGDRFEVTGVVEAVTPDHILVVAAAGQWVVPIRSLHAVVRPLPSDG